MVYEFKTIEERNSFIQEAYQKGLKYIYHEPRIGKDTEGFIYRVEVIEK